MKIEPHSHPEKEIYIFINGEGNMWIGKEKRNVRKWDAVYIPPNYIYTRGTMRTKT
ncbi:MAG: cupin domain-containing protein [Candidatus Bathyarchaeia archaeon]